MVPPLTSRVSGPVAGPEDLAERVRELHGDEDARLIERAYEFTSSAHEGQLRKSGEPYTSHPLQVAAILLDLHLDGISMAVALLHDVLEDTSVSREDLAREFGEEIAKLVEGVTKIGRMEFTSKVEEQAVNFRKLLLAMVDDVRVLLVKLADRLHNMRTLEHLRRDARLRIARETAEIYAPLAHRLGMGRIQTELEDLAFKHREPEAYAELSEKVESRLRRGESLTRSIVERIEKRMAEHDIPVQVAHRVKGILSLHRKMEARELDLDRVYDLLAFRIVTDSVRSCYAALGIIHQEWSPVPGRFKDFIAMPKRNMYQSLHTTVMESGRPFEVQIRTEEMHRIAEEGIAAHWLYKAGEDVSSEEAQPLVWLRQLVEWQREVQDPREFLSSLKLNLYPDEVYVFTPKGDVRALPRGSTPLDFAFVIHTDIGLHCSGARVNGKLVPLRQKLRNGDIVEIETSPDASPSRDWLEIVKTSRARNRIRNFLNKQERERSVDLGKKMLEKELRKYGLRVRKLLADGSLEAAAGQFGLGGAEDLLVAVSFGKVKVRPLAERLAPEGREPEDPPEPSRLRRLIDRALGWDADQAVRVEGIDDLMVYRARCCGPVPGEAILGYVTRGKGVSVHSASCPNIARLLQTDDRRVDVVWNAPKDSTVPVRLRVEVDDRKGLLAKITSAISDTGSNIRHIESKMRGQRGLVEVVLEVDDRNHLRRIRDALAGIDGVRAVRRGRTP